jgi:hypothetical protein
MLPISVEPKTKHRCTHDDMLLYLGKNVIVPPLMTCTTSTAPTSLKCPFFAPEMPLLAGTVLPQFLQIPPRFDVFWLRRGFTGVRCRRVFLLARLSRNILRFTPSIATTCLRCARGLWRSKCCRSLAPFGIDPRLRNSLSTHGACRTKRVPPWLRSFPRHSFSPLSLEVA